MQCASACRRLVYDARDKDTLDRQTRETNHCTKCKLDEKRKANAGRQTANCKEKSCKQKAKGIRLDQMLGSLPAADNRRRWRNLADTHSLCLLARFLKGIKYSSFNCTLSERASRPIELHSLFISFRLAATDDDLFDDRSAAKCKSIDFAPATIGCGLLIRIWQQQQRS